MRRLVGWGVAVALVAAIAAPVACAAPMVLRIQLVLVSLERGRAIPHKVADLVTEFLAAQIPGLQTKNVLRGEDRLILDFVTTPDKEAAVHRAIEGIATTRAGSFARVEAWKPIIEEAPLPTTGLPTPAPSVTPTATPVAASTATTTIGPATTIPSPPGLPLPDIENQIVDFRFETLDNGQFKIVARNVALGVLLEAVSGATEFSYVCPQSVWYQRLSLNVRSVGLEGLLTSLKTSLNLSITRVSSLYVIAPAPQGG